ncbi:hypothetical protein [Phocaeicola sp.]
MNTHIQLTMKQEVTTSIKICGHCKRELPMEAFYFNRQRQCHDNYCKECRKLTSRKQRKNENCFRYVNNEPHYPVITKIGDAKLRMFLILQALQRVRESAAEKRRKQYEQEFKEFE